MLFSTKKGRKQQLRVKIRAISTINLLSCLSLLLILAGFCALPLYGWQVHLLNDISLQRARIQRMSKDILILRYRPKIEQAQALSELQTTLPQFKIWQDRMLLFKNEQLQIFARQSQPDYTAAYNALLRISLIGIDDIHLQIVLDHERGYALALAQLTTTIQDMADRQVTLFFQIEAGIILIIMAALCLHQWFIIRKIVLEVEAHANNRPGL